MKVKLNRLRRLTYAALALATAAVATLPSLTGKVSAGQVTARSIQMSSSTPSATNTVYKVGFTVTNGATNIGGIVIDVCSQSPIVGDACTVPTGFNSNYATLTVANQSNITGLTVDTTNSTSNKIILTKTAGAPSAAALSFELGNGTTTGITNPSIVSTTGGEGSFYARIYTYTTTAAAQGHSQGTPTGYTDYGGVALSTGAAVTVTAKVQETLTFCVYISSCGDTTAVNLGDGNGVLASTGQHYTGTSKYSLGSNAQSGVIVRLKGDTLKTGSFSISPSGTTCTLDDTATTAEQFGLRVSAVGAGQTADAGYGCSSGSHALNVSDTCTNGDENVTCTYGDRIASTAAGTASSETTIEYTAKAATTTEAGIYTANLSYIATGTY